MQNLQRKNKYNIIVIGEYINSQNRSNIFDFYIVCFDYTLLLIPSTDFSLLFSIFEFYSESFIYYTSENIKTKIVQSWNQKIQSRFSEDNDRLLIERLIPSFLTENKLNFSNANSDITKTIQFAWDIIRNSFAFYMIKIGFLNPKYERNDKLSMYNLSHLYLYEDQIKDSIEKSIELLIHSIEKGFIQSKELLCLALFKKHSFNLYNIKAEIECITQGNKELSFDICTIIRNSGLLESIIRNMNITEILISFTDMI